MQALTMTGLYCGFRIALRHYIVLLNSFHQAINYVFAGLYVLSLFRKVITWLI